MKLISPCRNWVGVFGKFRGGDWVWGGSLALQAAVCSAGGAGAAFGSGEAVWEAVPNGALPDSGPLGGGPPAPPARGLGMHLLCISFYLNSLNLKP